MGSQMGHFQVGWQPKVQEFSLLVLITPDEESDEVVIVGYPERYFSGQYIVAKHKTKNNIPFTSSIPVV